MTGSSTEAVKQPTLAHAVSPQWTALLEAASSSALRFSSQPEHWWTLQADRLRSQWTVSGLPTMRLESWKYTSLVSLHEKPRIVQDAVLTVNAPGGVLVARLSDLKARAEKDQSVGPVEKLKALFLKKSDVEFENIARSMVADPYVIIIPAGFKAEAPIELSWESSSKESWGHGVVGILAGENTDVSIVESYGQGSCAMTLATFVDVAPGAKVGHLRLQRGVGADAVIASARVEVGLGAAYETSQVSFGAELSRENLIVELVGASAQTTVDGVYIGRGRQILDHHTELVHRVGQTKSAQVYKGILSDESRGIFNGRIAISKNASGSDSSQMNRNLLLSKKVEIDTKPQLEIDNDDVKAAHGAAIGRLDPEHVFYLRSRGIETSEAIEILSRGFAFEGVARLTSDLLRSRGTEAIEAGLRGLSWESL